MLTLFHIAFDSPRIVGHSYLMRNGRFAVIRPRPTVTKGPKL